MTILGYVLIPVLIVALFAAFSWFRNRQPTSLQSGVDSFRREMEALSPDADPLHRRRSAGPGSRPPSARPRDPDADEPSAGEAR